MEYACDTNLIFEITNWSLKFNNLNIFSSLRSGRSLSILVWLPWLWTTGDDDDDDDDDVDYDDNDDDDDDNIMFGVHWLTISKSREQN